MNDTSFLLIPQSPWLYIATISPSQITNWGWRIQNRIVAHVAVRFLRGSKMSTLDDLHNEVGATLQFPWYYGENWAAFDECITDLDWLPADSYLLIVTNAEEVLVKESDREFAVLIETLERAASEWAGQAAASDEAPRSSKPFHVIFQCTENREKPFVSRLQSAGASYDKLDIQK